MNIAIAGAVAVLLGGTAVAQDMTAHDMQGHVMGGHDMAAAAPGSTGLHEGGQSAFAAIAEATRLLEADPNTDWSKVKMDALHQHLVDMDNVTMRADVATTPIAGGARFEVTSADRRVRASIVRMTGLHAGMVNQEGLYKMAVEPIPSGMAMVVTGSGPADALKIRGLGFFGVLTEGMHHERHHLMLARGA